MIQHVAKFRCIIKHQLATPDSEQERYHLHHQEMHVCIFEVKQQLDTVQRGKQGGRRTMLCTQTHRKPGSLMPREQFMFIGRKAEAEDVLAKASTAKLFQPTQTKQN